MRYSLCTENHVCDMTATQIRLDFSVHISYTANVVCLCSLRLRLHGCCYDCCSHLLLAFQCRDGMCYTLCLGERIFCFYYTIGQLILHQQQTQWTKAKIAHSIDWWMMKWHQFKAFQTDIMNHGTKIYFYIYCFILTFISHQCARRCYTDAGCYCYYFCSFCLHFASFVLCFHH